MKETIRLFLREDSAQDIVEYAYLALFIGLTGIVLWPAIALLIRDRYENYNTNVQSEPLWKSPEPAESP
jgi:Flp pilus assembly pilin Flp